MYLETMQQVFSNTSKVYVESRAGNSNLLYAAARSAVAAGRRRPAWRQAAAAPPRANGAPLEPPADVNRARDGLRSRDRDSSR
jgi:membrane protease subunit HflK